MVRRLGGELVVEIDGLGVASGLAIELGERELGEAARSLFQPAGDLFEGALGGGVLAGLPCR